MKHDRRPQLPLYTSRAVIRVNIDEEEKGDSRHFWPHFRSIEERKHRCCVRWCKGRRTWVPTESPCPEGTHDFLVCTAFVVYAHTAQPWKKAPKKVNPKTNPNIKLLIRAHGEIARQLYVATTDERFLVEGHVTTYYNFGRLWNQLNLFSLKKVSDEQIKSQLSVIAFDRFRSTIKDMAQPVKELPPMELSGLEEIRARRLAKRRGEVL